MWDSILSLLSSVVSPDWGKLVGLIPLAVGGMLALYLVFLFRRAATVPPRRTRPLPAPSLPPGVHMPGPSFAPVMAAFGAFCFFLALLFVRVGPQTDGAGKVIPDSSTWTIQPFGVLAIALGVLALGTGLLFWGREATRDYDRLEPRAALTATAQSGTPAGIHIPAPSFRPLLVAVAVSVLLFGLVIDLAIVAGGLVMLVTALLGWLRDARLEYREVEHADASGHLAALAAPRYPTGTFVAFGLVLTLSVLVATGVLPPRTTSPTAAGGGAVASGAPAPGSAAPGSPAASGGAPTEVPGGGAGGALQLTAQGVNFDKKDLVAPANTPFKLTFVNNDGGIPHNVAIHKDSPTGAEVFKGEIFSGVATKTYDVPALPAGTYGFVCSVHPTMTGTLTVK